MEFEKDFKEWLNKKQFEIVSDEYDLVVNYEMFKTYPFSMQWGVYVDFFIENKIFVNVSCYHDGAIKDYDWIVKSTIRTCYKPMDLECKNIHESRKAALTKAIEIYGSK